MELDILCALLNDTPYTLHLLNAIFFRCEEFARQKCKVYASSRKIETISDFEDKTIEKISLDVTSDESVQNALKHIIDKEGKIDVVVNNAGLISPGTPYIYTIMKYMLICFPLQ